MPYVIKPCPNAPGYKVFSPTRPLSKKCLPLETAKKQRIAVYLSQKRRGQMGK
jgi:hypothetical protein